MKNTIFVLLIMIITNTVLRVMDLDVITVKIVINIMENIKITGADMVIAFIFGIPFTIMDVFAEGYYEAKRSEENK